MYGKTQRQVNAPITTHTHTNAILHRSTNTRLDYTRAVAQELLIRMAHPVDPIPADAIPYPLSNTSLQGIAAHLTIRAAYHANASLGEYATKYPFTPVQVVHLLFLKLQRGVRFG